MRRECPCCSGNLEKYLMHYEEGYKKSKVSPKNIKKKRVVEEEVVDEYYFCNNCGYIFDWEELEND